MSSIEKSSQGMDADSDQQDDPAHLQTPPPPPIPVKDSARGMQMMLQAGNFPPDPESTKHISEYLRHDSDNQLSFLDRQGGRDHEFRQRVIVIAAGLVLVVLAMPVIALFQGHAAAFDAFMDRHLHQIIGVVGAFLGGLGISRFLMK